MSNFLILLLEMVNYKIFKINNYEQIDVYYINENDHILEICPNGKNKKSRIWFYYIKI